jgi:DegV family protein with EDD domain
MTVKIVTDSVADLPEQIVQAMGITVIPLIVSFGKETYRDGVDLTANEFFHKLQFGRDMPVTSVPSPVVFAKAYDEVAEKTDEILVITLSSRLSGTYDVARHSIGLMKKNCRVEVLDSRLGAMAEGLVVIKAAQAAIEGKNLDSVIDIVRRSISRIGMCAAFDTLEYLRRGGRIGKAQAFLGSMLNINPIIGLKNGEVVPIARERSRAKAIDYLCNFVTGYAHVEEMAIEYATMLADAETLMRRLDSKFPRQRIYSSRSSPVIGTHTGPGLLVVSVLGDV